MQIWKTLTERSEETGVSQVLETSARVLATTVMTVAGWTARVRSRLRRGPAASFFHAGVPAARTGTERSGG